MYYCGLWMTKEENIAIIVWDKCGTQSLKFDFTCDETGLKTLINNWYNHGIVQSNLIIGLNFYYTGEEWSDDYQKIYYVWYFLKSYGFDARFYRSNSIWNDIEVKRTNVYEKIDKIRKMAIFLRNHNKEKQYFISDNFKILIDFEKSLSDCLWLAAASIIFFYLMMHDFDIKDKKENILYFIIFFSMFINEFLKLRMKKPYLEIDTEGILIRDVSLKNNNKKYKWSEIGTINSCETKALVLYILARFTRSIVFANRLLKSDSLELTVPDGKKGINYTLMETNNYNLYYLIKFYWANFGWYYKK